MKKIKTTKLPLSVERVRNMVDKDGFIQIVFPFEVNELMRPVDEVNDLISEYVSGGDSTMLEGISYRAVGTAKGHRILMQVIGSVTNWLASQHS